MPETVLDAIRGRNVTVNLKSDYITGMVKLNGLSLPSSLSGQKAYSIAQLKNRAQYASGSTGTGKTEGNPATGMEPIGTTGISAVMQSSSAAVQKPVEQTGISSASSSSSEGKAAPPIMEVPDLPGEPSLPAIEETVEAPAQALNLTAVAVGVLGAVAVILIVLAVALSGRKRRHRRG